MKASGPRFERETIINFNEEDATASIWTASDKVYRRLMKRLGRAYLTEDGERHAVFTFPSNFLGLPRVKSKNRWTLTAGQNSLPRWRMQEIYQGPARKTVIPESMENPIHLQIPVPAVCQHLLCMYALIFEML